VLQMVFAGWEKIDIITFESILYYSCSITIVYTHASPGLVAIHVRTPTPKRHCKTPTPVVRHIRRRIRRHATPQRLAARRICVHTQLPEEPFWAVKRQVMRCTTTPLKSHTTSYSTQYHSTVGNAKGASQPRAGGPGQKMTACPPPTLKHRGTAPCMSMTCTRAAKQRSLCPIPLCSVIFFYILSKVGVL
jgi:hypothetical protein